MSKGFIHKKIEIFLLVYLINHKSISQPCGFLESYFKNLYKGTFCNIVERKNRNAKLLQRDIVRLRFSFFT